MNIKKHLLHGVYWITAIIIFILGFLIKEFTYYLFLISIVYAIYGVLTFALYNLKKSLNKLGFWTHYVFTTIGTLFITTLLFLSTRSNLTNYNEHIVSHEEGIYEVYSNYSGWIGNLALAIILIQILFISSFIRSMRRPRHSEASF